MPNIEQSTEFDKDNFYHLELLHCLANLRCHVYSIKECTWEQTLREGAKIQGQTSLALSAICGLGIN